MGPSGIEHFKTKTDARKFCNKEVLITADEIQSSCPTKDHTNMLEI